MSTDDNTSTTDNTDNTEAFDPATDSDTVTRGPVSYADLRGDAVNALFDFASEQAKPVVTGVLDPVSGATALIVIDRNGVKALDASVFDHYLDGPRRRGGTATLLDLDSLIAHVNRYADGGSVVFADNNRDKPSVTAVLDYHGADERADELTPGKRSPARFGRHRSLFNFPLSDEWKAWNAVNGKALTMKEFARFLEDHIVDVMPPEQVNLSEAASKFVDRLGGVQRIANPAQLMQLAQNFEVYEASNAGQSANLSTGEGRFSFETVHTDANGQALEVPQSFVLGIPVFKGSRFCDQVFARLRYRKDGGQIVFFYELWRLDLVFDAAFNEAVETIKAETNVPVLYGAPEAG